jgi:ribosome biogenesis GTPase
VVGDYLWCEYRPHEPADLVRALVPRYSAIRRAAAGERVGEQILAANVDRALLVTGLDRDFNPRRLERYLALVTAAEVMPVVVLTKADLHPDPSQAVAEIEALDSRLRIYAINAKDPESIDVLWPELGPGQTLVLLGSSGAGKSTLTNTLLGEDRQRCGAVRARDGRGRHTTVTRALLSLPNGACLIDTPGLRELKLTGAEDLEQGVFQDIAEFAAQCRFRDCRHQQEPGCAVQAALADGRLDPGRYANYRKLTAEREQAASQSPRALEPKAGGKRSSPAPTRRHGRT